MGKLPKPQAAAPQTKPALSFRISPTLKASLESLAQADRRNLSQYVELVLERHVAETTAKRPR